MNISGLVALPDASYSVTNLIPATISDLSMSADPTPNDIYTTLPGQGKQFVLFPIEAIVGTVMSPLSVTEQAVRGVFDRLRNRTAQ